MFLRRWKKKYRIFQWLLEWHRKNDCLLTPIRFSLLPSSLEDPPVTMVHPTRNRRVTCLSLVKKSAGQECSMRLVQVMRMLLPSSTLQQPCPSEETVGLASTGVNLRQMNLNWTQLNRLFLPPMDSMDTCKDSTELLRLLLLGPLPLAK